MHTFTLLFRKLSCSKNMANVGSSYIEHHKIPTSLWQFYYNKAPFFPFSPEKVDTCLNLLYTLWFTLHRGHVGKRTEAANSKDEKDIDKEEKAVRLPPNVAQECTLVCWTLLEQLGYELKSVVIHSEEKPSTLHHNAYSSNSSECISSAQLQVRRIY